MSAFLRMFNVPLVAHAGNEQDQNDYLQLTVVDEKKAKQPTKDPKMVFGSYAPVPHVMTLSNQHPSESMLCVVFPPLPKESYEKPFAGAIWRTVLNKWRLDDNNGWMFRTTIESFANEEFKTIVLKAGETRRIDVWANDQVEYGSYSLKVYGWCRGMPKADHSQITVVKFGSKLVKSVVQETTAEVFARELAKLMMRKTASGVSLSDVGLELETHAEVVPPDYESEAVWKQLSDLALHCKHPTDKCTSPFVSANCSGSGFRSPGLAPISTPLLLGELSPIQSTSLTQTTQPPLANFGFVSLPRLASAQLDDVATLVPPNHSEIVSSTPEKGRNKRAFLGRPGGYNLRSTLKKVMKSKSDPNENVSEPGNDEGEINDIESDNNTPSTSIFTLPKEF